MRLLIILFALVAQAQTVAVKHRQVMALPLASAPTFSPTAGAVSNPTTITISSADGCGSYIYWKTSAGVTSGDTHSTSFSVTGAGTWYAKIIGCPSKSDSNEASAAYTVTASPPALITSGSAQAAGASVQVQVTGLNCTGANFYVVAVSTNSTSFTVTDSQGSTYSNLTQYSDAVSTSKIRLSYVSGVTGGSSMTFQATAAYPAIAVACFSGVLSASALDAVAGRNDQATSNVTKLLGGSITPGATNELLITAMGFANDGSNMLPLVIDNSYTVIQNRNFVLSTYFGIGLGWKLSTSTSAVEPGWNTTASNGNGAGTHAAFKHQ